MRNQPHSKYQHVYVVLRIDTYKGRSDEFDEDHVAVTSVYWTEEEANAEVERLDRLDMERGGGSRYITRIGRLKPDDLSKPEFPT